jgi:hypothetical protein
LRFLYIKRNHSTRPFFLPDFGFLYIFRKGMSVRFSEISACFPSLPDWRHNSRTACAGMQPRKWLMVPTRSGCAITWTSVRDITFPPNTGRASPSFLVSRKKRGNRRLSKSRLLAPSGSSTRFTRKSLRSGSGSDQATLLISIVYLPKSGRFQALEPHFHASKCHSKASKNTPHHGRDFLRGPILTAKIAS